MKKIAFLFGFLFLLNHPVHAANWTKQDTQLQLAYTALHVIDWGQTRYIATHEEYYEVNAFLGKDPSIQSVDIYFASTLVGHTLVSYLLPPDWRKIWQIVWIGAKFKTVADNYSLGISIHF